MCLGDFCGIHTLDIFFLTKVVWDVDIVPRSNISMEVVINTKIVGYSCVVFDRVKVHLSL
jgi:hypothetical protein